MERPEAVRYVGDDGGSVRERVVSADDVLNLRIDMATLSDTGLWDRYFLLGSPDERRSVRTGGHSQRTRHTGG